MADRLLHQPSLVTMQRIHGPEMQVLPMPIEAVMLELVLSHLLGQPEDALVLTFSQPQLQAFDLKGEAVSWNGARWLYIFLRF